MLPQLVRFNPTATVVQYDGGQISFEVIKELLSGVQATAPATASKTLVITHKNTKLTVEPGQWVCVFMGTVSVLEDAEARAAIYGIS